MNPETDPVISMLFAVVIAFFIISLFVALVVRIKGFIWELDSINREIGRTSGEEQRYWKRQKRRLWLSLLPFYRR